MWHLTVLTFLILNCQANRLKPTVYLFPMFEVQNGLSFVNITTDFIDSCQLANKKYDWL
jgi:hypothetical protein